MLIDIGFIIVGLITLYFGGNFVVTACTRLAKYFNISPFIIGATVIGLGTSAPELAVSVLASVNGYGELALGNVIGSNIANIGLVLGLTGLFVPITIEETRLKKESPALIIASILVVVLAWNNHLNRTEGLAMLTLLLIYLLKTFSQKEYNLIQLEEDSFFLVNKGIVIQFVLVILGIVMLVFGANSMVEGATGIARKIGISEWFIGVTIVAVGTSLPELVSSLIAAKRGHGEMAIGNVFGSNIFNIFLVIGTAATIHPLIIKEYIHPDLIYLIILTFLIIMMIRGGRLIEKKKGILLIFCYIGYIGLNGTNAL